MKKNFRIGVLAGGPSSEREVSLKSGDAVFKALDAEKFNVVFLDIKGNEDIKTLIKDNFIEAVFIALHGKFGEDGTVQRLLDEIDVPYTGSGPEASRLALDKIASRLIFLSNNIPSPEFRLFNKNSSKALDLCFPVVVKPQFEGSSIGLSIVDNQSDLDAAKDLAFKYGDNVLIEKYVNGRELTVGVLNDNVLPVVEIKPKSKFYDYNAKYSRTDTEYIVPAQLSVEDFRSAQAIARSAHNSLGCRQFSRVDMILDDRHNFYVLEVNTIPGFTSRSLFPKAANAFGLSFNELCVNLINGAMNTKEKITSNV